MRIGCTSNGSPRHAAPWYLRTGANTRIIHSCFIPNSPASATGPGLECRAPTKHGLGVCMHMRMPRRSSQIARRATAHAHPHRNHIQPVIAGCMRLRASCRASPGCRIALHPAYQGRGQPELASEECHCVHKQLPAGPQRHSAEGAKFRDLSTAMYSFWMQFMPSSLLLVMCKELNI